MVHFHFLMYNSRISILEEIVINIFEYIGGYIWVKFYLDHLIKFQ